MSGKKSAAKNYCKALEKEGLKSEMKILSPYKAPNLFRNIPLVWWGSFFNRLHVEFIKFKIELPKITHIALFNHCFLQFRIAYNLLVY